MINRIQNESAWLALIERYKDNWELAAKELLDIELTPHQAKIINAIKNEPKSLPPHHMVLGKPLLWQ